MDCPNEETLVQFVGGQLPPAALDSVHQHLDQCQTCRTVVGVLGRPTHSEGLGPTEPSLPGAQHWSRGALVGRYTVLEAIGQGGMGEVYSAYDPRLDRRVALKLLRGSHAGTGATATDARLVREAQAMARLAHPNVVAVYDVGTAGDQVFVSMELVEGQTLGRWLQQKPGWREVLRAFIDAGRGLAAAHAKGLVHRDFKPSNVLVGTDGRVRVTDFGLARGIEAVETESAALAQGSVLDLKMTGTGALIGTPAYMAPEQLRRGAADARSDQFSFCVALYEGLFGSRPFRGDRLDELLTSVNAGAQTPPSGSPVPPSVQRAVMRGLSADPSQRFDTVDDLLAELDRSLAPGRSRSLVFSLAVAALALGALVVGVVRGERPADCAVPATALDGAWDEPLRAQVRAAIGKSDRPYAANALTLVEQTLDGRAASWRAMRREACEATWVNRTQSGALLDARMRCLDSAKEELGATAQLFAHADADLIESSNKVLSRLTPLSRCADAKALTAKVAPPADPVAPKVAELSRQLTRTRVLISARPKEAVTALDQLREQAEQLGYRPLQAAVLADLGEAKLAASDAAGAEQSLNQAIALADATGSDFDRARALITQVDAVGYEQARAKEGEAFAQQAQAVVERIGADPTLQARLEERTGKLLYGESHYDEARKHYERSLALREQLYGPNHPEVADALQLLAICNSSLNQIDKALAQFNRALQIREAALGHDHPDVAATYNTLAIDASDRGDYLKALEQYQQALDIRVKALGPEHTRVGHVLENMAVAELSLGRFEDAERDAAHALAIESKTMGSEHPALAELYQTQAVIAGALGHEADARARCQHALDVTLKARPGHVRLGLSQLDCGEAELRLGHPKEALQHLEQARPILTQKLEPAQQYVVQLEVATGAALLALHREKDAVAPLEKALDGLAHGEGVNPDLLARTKANLAKALESDPAQKARAQQLASEAETIQRARPWSKL